MTVEGAEAVPLLRPTRLLLAEDVSVNRELIRGVLKPSGALLDEVENGAQAVAALERTPYDLVLMDMQMPVMDGLTATAAIRALGGRCAEVPIIALTASVTPEQVRACLAAGVTDHLAKPFTAARLEAMIRRWTERDGDPLARALQRLGSTSAPRELKGLLLHLARQLDLFEACSPGDRMGLRQQAHALRGGAALLGLKTLASACREVEYACRLGEDPAAALSGAYAEIARARRQIDPKIAA